MDLKQQYALDDRQRKRLEQVYEGYKRLSESPENCVPMLSVVVDGYPCLRGSYYQMTENPMQMLEAQLSAYTQHLLVEDDAVPTVRVNFGTGQPASAFGCALGMPTDDVPIAVSHAVKKTEDIYQLKVPALSNGIYPKVAQFTEVFRENLPEGMFIQHPDIQSAFNTAHLVRGNDILLDFYDDPEAVDFLLDVITDFMIPLTRHLKSMIEEPFEGWFFDWGAMWKGAARISNCSTHMISPELYKKHILGRDLRFLKELGGGRIHYCGAFPAVISSFMENQYSNGLDVDSLYHDAWSIKSRNDVVIYHDFSLDSEMGRKIMKGELPKRNVILRTNVKSVEEGKEVYKRFKLLYQ